MHTILIAHQHVTYAAQLTSQLRASGYRVISCPGPWPPLQRCIRCDKGYCPLTEGADLMIYDPMLTGLNTQGEMCNLALDSALAHPEVPMLLAWSPTQVPDLGTLRAMQSQAPRVDAAAREPAALLRQIHASLDSTPTPP